MVSSEFLDGDSTYKNAEKQIKDYESRLKTYNSGKKIKDPDQTCEVIPKPANYDQISQQYR